MRVALFLGCYNQAFYPEVGQATGVVLERLGCLIECPSSQTCCGQMHHNSGCLVDAGRLARKFIREFGGYEHVVVPSSSCTAMVRNGFASLARRAGDRALALDAAQIAARVFEFCAFIEHAFDVRSVGAYFPHKVVYHPTCSSLRGLALGDTPLQLLRAVRGLELLGLEDAAECCGFGGTFAVKNADVSAAMLSDKMRAVISSGAEYCTAVDNSCLMHIGGGLARLNAGVRTIHIAEILASNDDGAEL